MFREEEPQERTTSPCQLKTSIRVRGGLGSNNKIVRVNGDASIPLKTRVCAQSLPRNNVN